MSTRRMNKRIRNKVRIAGQIAYIHFNDKSAVLAVNTGPTAKGNRVSIPRVVVFDKVLDKAHNFKVGDYVLIDATMQSNRIGDNLPPRTVAVNHMVKLNPEDPRYHTANRFDFYGVVVKAEKVNNRKAKATIRIYTGRQINYITVYYESDDKEKVDAFCNLKTTDYVFMNGYIMTSKTTNKDNKATFLDKLVVNDFGILS